MSVLLTERHALRPVFRFVVLVGVLSLFFFEWFLLDLATAPKDPLALVILLVVIALVGVFGWRFFRQAGHHAVARFKEALSAEERRAGLARAISAALPADSLCNLLLQSDSPAIGGTVVSLDIRAKTGASVVAVRRNGVETRNVGAEWTFCAGDLVIALGDDVQIAALKTLLGVS